MKLNFKKSEIFFLLFVYLIGVGFRLIPRLSLDPHLLTFQADIWYRLCLAQYVVDNGHLPVWDIRYLAYGHVPFWYNPLSLYFFAFLHHLTHLDLPTICSRVMPFVESFSVITIYFLCRELYNKRVAVLATIILLLSPSQAYWTGISTLQSFTIFLLPLSILLWVRFLQKKFFINNKWAHLTLMGVLYALNFLTHLSYFTHMIMLFCVHLSLVIERKARLRDTLYLLVPVIISQILTSWWWLPHNLYWWWSTGLTTSSGFNEGLQFLQQYGYSAAIIGHLAFIAIVLFCVWKWRSLPAFYLIPVFWALFPMIESHNEGLLVLFKRLDLTWNNLFKPLEGFRFYVFLTQPLAICTALLADRMAESFLRNGRFFKRAIAAALAMLLCGILIYDMFFIYKLSWRFQIAGIGTRDIKAATWFRENTPPTSRILSDYYNAQMISGICGGKALLGALFPLKGVNIPYINEKTKVQADIYSVYLNYDAQNIRDIFHRYGVTHIYVSDGNIGYIETFASGMYQQPMKVDKARLHQVFSDPTLFKLVYQDGDIEIFELVSN